MYKYPPLWPHKAASGKGFLAGVISSETTHGARSFKSSEENSETCSDTHNSSQSKESGSSHTVPSFGLTSSLSYIRSAPQPILKEHRKPDSKKKHSVHFGTPSDSSRPKEALMHLRTENFTLHARVHNLDSKLSRKAREAEYLKKQIKMYKDDFERLKAYYEGRLTTLQKQVSQLELSLTKKESELREKQGSFKLGPVHEQQILAIFQKIVAGGKRDFPTLTPGEWAEIKAVVSSKKNAIIKASPPLSIGHHSDPAWMDWPRKQEATRK